MSYASGTDMLCYPGTSVLRNKAGVPSQAALDAFELEMVISRAKEAWPPGQLDAQHYLSLQNHLFQDVYQWAGTIRTIRIGKAGSWFCYPEHIESEMAKLFGWLAREHHFVDLSQGLFVAKAARFLSELNAIHPFREGNGHLTYVDCRNFKKLVRKRKLLPLNSSGMG